MGNYTHIQNEFNAHGGLLFCMLHTKNHSFKLLVPIVPKILTSKNISHQSIATVSKICSAITKAVKQEEYSLFDLIRPIVPFVSNCKHCFIHQMPKKICGPIFNNYTTNAPNQYIMLKLFLFFTPYRV